MGKYAGKYDQMCRKRAKYEKLLKSMNPFRNFRSRQN
jgi:hypothetical protein